MENAVNQNKSLPQMREIGIVTAEIKELRRQAACVQVAYAVEIGRRLVEAKKILPFGAWGDWLKNEVEFSQSTANNLMKIFEEFGDTQITLLGAVSNSQTIGNLPYSKALQLLSLPADERESFAKEVNAENLSARELKEAVNEKLTAEKQAREAEQRAAEAQKAAEVAESARREAEQRASEADELQKKIKDLEAKLESEQTAHAKSKKKLAEAKLNPKIPTGELERIRAEAEKTAKSEVEMELSEELAKARESVERVLEESRAAKERADAAEEALRQAQKSLKTANPRIAVFKNLFEDFQERASKLKRMANDIQKDDPEIGEKLLAALNAAIRNLGC